MTNEQAIFIFTKDRPETLNKTLDSIKDILYTKYVIDDSVNINNQQSVYLLCEKNYNCNYMGKIQFNEFVELHKIDFPKFSFLLRELGNVEWNLGYARNFALLYSKGIDAKKVLFMDDDIEVDSINVINNLFDCLEKYQFAGANICRMTDHSIIEHISIELGIINDIMLSGGFMVFKPQLITDYFLNIYNEDWIWLYLQLENKSYVQTEDVYQEIFDPFNKYEEKILFQEFGELIIDGILDLFRKKTFDDLESKYFWRRMLSERTEYLNSLDKQAKVLNNKEYSEIIQWVKNNSEIFNEELFAELFNKYFYNRNLFQNLFKSLS